MTVNTGRQLANFRIERLIGRGGMAEVYYGTDIKLGRPVAIKILDSRYHNRPDYARRFVQEARAIATWHHPNVIQVYYADDTNGLYYFAMEFIDGMDLADLLHQYHADHELIPHEDVIRIGRAIADALDYAHARGVIHRDVKPSNVLISRDNRVVLSDFGLAMDTGQGSLGQIFGTPHYIAPEQAKRSADAIPQSDLYSFGVLLYEMLTGEVPFDDVSATGLALQHMTQPPPAPRSLNPALNLDTEKVLLRALSKEPENRFASGKEMIEALEKALKKKSRAKSLPPLPAGVEPPARVLSMKTVSHRVAAFDHNTLPRPAIDAVFPLPAIPAAQNHSTARRGFSWWGLFWALLGSLTTLAFAGLLLLVFNLLLADTASETPVPLQEGKPVLLLYNENNFYMQNTGEQSIEVGKLKFEALDGEGISRAVFYGTRWSGTDPLLDPNACMSLEYYIDRVSAFPEQCPGREAYVELSSISEFVFWTARRGAVEFRVMWNGSEVGRCPVTEQTADAAECRIYLP